MMEGQAKYNKKKLLDFQNGVCRVLLQAKNISWSLLRHVSMQ